MSYDQIHEWTQQVVHQAVTDQFVPDVVVGISRGGLLPALIASHVWHVPMIAWSVNLRDHVTEPQMAHWFAPLVAQGKRVLVWDDINDTGATLAWIRSHLAQRLTWITKAEDELSDFARMAVLLNKATSTQCVDYAAHGIPESQTDIWWVFPWEAA